MSKILIPGNVRFILFILLFLILPRISYSQDTCSSSGDQSLEPLADGWIGHVYQTAMETTPNVETFMNTGQYKGVLKSSYLPAGEVNFVTDFGNYGDPTNDDIYANITDGGCDTRLSYFGVVFKGKYTIPDIGTYKITIISDDGATLDINGARIHNRWMRQDYNAGNARSYYITYSGGTELNLELRYFELNIYNKVSFNIERYYGPGVISGDQRISSVNPDPAPFVSLAPAEFEDGSTPVYEWFYNTSNDSDSATWTPINNSNNIVFNIPAFEGSSDPFEGLRYYHRRATGGGTTYISNAVEVNLCRVTQIADHTVYGEQEWIGYVYNGYVPSLEGGFEKADFMGRVKEPAIFSQGFGGDTAYFPTLAEDGGCSFFTDKFSIRYKMKILVTPGTYNYEVVGDDGFRLMIEDGEGNYLGTDDDVPGNYAIYNWTTGGATDERKRAIKNNIVINEDTYLYFTLDYFENIYGNYISFDYSGDPFSVLPLEWGKVAAEACGPANCLSWETIQEKNTSHFELERSYNGIDWEMFDNSIIAQGTSTEKINYAFKDKLFTAVKVYYRIRQVDLDGAFDYSEVVRVDNPHHAKGFLPFPNPTVEKVLFYSTAEVVKLFVINNDLTLHEQVKPERLSDSRYEVNLSRYRPGTYVILVQTKDGRKEVFKVIKK